MACKTKNIQLMDKLLDLIMSQGGRQARSNDIDRIKQFLQMDTRLMWRSFEQAGRSSDRVEASAKSAASKESTRR